MRWSLPVTLLVGAVATTVVGVGGVVAVRAGEALPGTSVAGVDVGGLGPDGIGDRLAGTVDARTGGTLLVVDDEQRFPLQRADLGVQVDLEETADRALDAGRSGSPLDAVLGPLLGRGEPVELAVDVEDAAVRRAVDGIAEQLDVAPSAGGFSVEGTTVTTALPTVGRTLQRDLAADELDSALTAGRTDPLPLPVEEITPSATPEQVEQVAASAREALSAPYRLTGAEQVLELGPTRLAPLLSAEPVDGGGLRLAVDRAGLEEAVTAAAARIDRAPVAASFSFAEPQPIVDTQGDLSWSPRPASVGVTPSVPGLAVDVAAATDTLVGLVGTPEHEGQLPAGEVAPAVSTEQAQGVTNVIGTFTTRYTAGQPRASNIRRIAEIMDGTYIAPGEQLSINEIVGRRTADKGFVADSAIIDGELVDQIGGGVSQFATTIFNGYFFAGLEDVTHTPHSYYISRYPPGRESTVSYPQPDFRFRNDSPHGVLIQTSYTGTSLTVTFWGTKRYDVRSVSGPRYAPTSLTGVTYNTRPDCEASAGGTGFSINVARIFLQGGREVKRETLRTRYLPEPHVICGPSPTPSPVPSSPPPPASPLPTPAPSPSPTS